MTQPVLQVQKLTKIFNSPGRAPVRAVDGVSFLLEDKESLGLIGESGSGKSTLSLLLTRLMDPTEGRIMLDGEDITFWKGGNLKKVYKKEQMVFQSPTGSFDPRRTLGDGIGESLRNQGMARKEADRQVKELLQLCGLEKEYAGRYPHEVSGGQCQRAAIARAIAVRPKLLILDEATSALDVTIQKEILELLLSLREKMNISYLFICHNIALVQQFCDRVLVMHEGRIVEEGIPNDIINHPENAYTRALIESVL